MKRKPAVVSIVNKLGSSSENSSTGVGASTKKAKSSQRSPESTLSVVRCADKIVLEKEQKQLVRLRGNPSGTTAIVVQPSDPDGQERRSGARRPNFLSELTLYSCFRTFELTSDDQGAKTSNDLLEQFRDQIQGGILQLCRDVKPSDDLERLIVELLAFHAIRTLTLGRLAAARCEADKIKILNEATDGASDSFRKLLMAYTAYRALKNR
jgi:hypothetical protein